MVHVLPEILGQEPVVLFCGQAGAESPRIRDHYYEGPGNAFWDLLHRSGLTDRRLRPDEDHLVPSLGFGLTDLVGHDRRSWVEYDALASTVGRVQPLWVALTSKGLGAEVARELGERKPGLGIAPFTIAGAGVFVLPGTSGANQRHDYDGRPNRLAWFRELAELVAPDLAEFRDPSRGAASGRPGPGPDRA